MKWTDAREAVFIHQTAHFILALIEFFKLSTGKDINYLCSMTLILVQIGPTKSLLAQNQFILVI
jgi:hypothetical protein